jgi:hypothetical protein
MQHPRLNLRQRVGDLVPQEINLSGEEIGDGWGGAAISHDRRFETERIAHHDGAQVAVTANAAMREVRLRALLSNPVHQILRVGAGNGLAADQKHRRIVDKTDRLEGRLRVIPQIIEQARRRQETHVVDQDAGAVGCRTRHALVGHCAAAPDHILDDDRAAEGSRHLVADEARHCVGPAAGRVGHHQGEGLGSRLRLGLWCKRHQQ